MDALLGAAGCPFDWSNAPNTAIPEATRDVARMMALLPGLIQYSTADEMIRDLLESLQPMAERLGCTTQLTDVGRILDHGPGYARPRAIKAAGGSPVDVVDTLVRELETDEPVRP